MFKQNWLKSTQSEKKKTAALTSYFQGCIVTDRLAQIISGHTDVAAVVWLAPTSVNDAQEEEGSAGQQHAVGARVVSVRLNALAIFIPFHCRGWTALCLTVERGWFPFRHNQIRGVLYNPGWEVFLSETRP